MISQRYALVLASNPQHSLKLSILKSDGLRLLVSINTQFHKKNSNNAPSIPIGSIIGYQSPENDDSRAFISPSLEYIPWCCARTDILFLHHILEICSFFLPVGISSPETYALIQALYALDCSVLTYANKLLFILKLLLMVVPEYPVTTIPAFLSSSIFLQTSLDPRTFEKIDLTYQQELQKWLMGCIMNHPQASRFKTIHFLRGVHYLDK